MDAKKLFDPDTNINFGCFYFLGGMNKFLYCSLLFIEKHLFLPKIMWSSNTTADGNNGSGSVNDFQIMSGTMLSQVHPYREKL